jgi:hypothetical protein
LTTFRENYRQLQDLKTSFEANRITLLRAARLARAVVPDQRKEFKELVKAQREVNAELDKLSTLVTNPATVQTRLIPRLERLENVYVPTYLDEVMTLDSVQGELDEVAISVIHSAELRLLRRFDSSLEAKRAIETAETLARSVPLPLRRKGEERDIAKRDVRAEGYVSDIIDSAPLTLKRLDVEISTRAEKKKSLADSAATALESFAEFLRSTKIAEGLKAHSGESGLAAAVVAAQTTLAIKELLLAADESEVAGLSNVLEAVSGGKKPKCVKMSTFRPRSDVIWDKTDIPAVAGEFQRYLEQAWEEGWYIKIET